MLRRRPHTIPKTRRQEEEDENEDYSSSDYEGEPPFSIQTLSRIRDIIYKRTGINQSELVNKDP